MFCKHTKKGWENSKDSKESLGGHQTLKGCDEEKQCLSTLASQEKSSISGKGGGLERGSVFLAKMKVLGHPQRRITITTTMKELSAGKGGI